MKAEVAEAPTRLASPSRWAGGKRWLIPTVEELTSETEIGAYHEPFLGGASVFLGLPPFPKAFLRDANAELIATFGAIRDHPEQIAEHAREHANDEDSYYEVRASDPKEKIARAARFLYLNHTSFNGIYRVNLDGVYNVPFGHGRTARLPTADHLREVSARLKKAKLNVGDFEGCVKQVNAGDLVFLDPPYTVAHNHNGFVKYNQRLFSFDDQRRLSELVDEIKKRGAYYILANAAHQSIAELFAKGDRQIETNRRNSIGGNNAARGSATEYLFTNLNSAG
jgi:DNA adenine methylase